MSNANTQIKFLGVTDEVTTCDLCGKTNLKRTVVFDIDGAIVHYGTNCAETIYPKSAGVKKAQLDTIANLITFYNTHAATTPFSILANRINVKFGYSLQISRVGKITINTNVGIVCLNPDYVNPVVVAMRSLRIAAAVSGLSVELIPDYVAYSVQINLNNSMGKWGSVETVVVSDAQTGIDLIEKWSALAYENI